MSSADTLVILKSGFQYCEEVLHLLLCLICRVAVVEYWYKLLGILLPDDYMLQADDMSADPLLMRQGTKFLQEHPRFA